MSCQVLVTEQPQLFNTDSSSASHHDESTPDINDLAARRRAHNRVAQRNYRKKLKRRLAWCANNDRGSNPSSKSYESQYNIAALLDDGSFTFDSGHHCAVALYDYAGESDTLAFHRGDMIELTGDHSNGWVCGSIGSQYGWVPGNYFVSAEQPGSYSHLTGVSAKEASLDGEEDNPTRATSQCKKERFPNHCPPSKTAFKPEEEVSEDPAKTETYTEAVDHSRIWSLLQKFQSNLTPRKHSHELPSDGELSFAGVNNTSGNVTPSNELAPTSRELALGLATRILQDYARQQRGAAEHNTMDAPQEGSGNSSSGSSPPSSAHSKDTELTLPSISKRKFSTTNKAGNEHDQGDDEDDEEAIPPRKKNRSNSKNEIKLFACPFAKLDPARYSERNTTEAEYRSCSSCLLRDIARLKQHLYRTHRRPDHYCPSCFDAFKTQALLDEHVRERSCEIAEPLYGEKMTKDQMNLIKRRHRGESPAQNWFSIFKILFPEATPPESPYAGEGDSDSAALQHFVHYFRTFGPEQFFNLMRDRQGSMQRLEASTQAIVDEAFEIAAPELMQQLQSRRTTIVDTSQQWDIRYESAMSAAGTIWETSQDEAPQRSVSRRNSTDPWLDPLAPNLSTGGGLPDVFDFDTTFDPLTIEDSFLAYGSWYQGGC